MTTLKTDDTIIRRFDSRDARRGRSPYIRYPERDSWVTGTVYERADGSRYTVKVRHHRWADVTVHDEPVTIEAVS
jgi:hypothetical protein